MQEKEDDNDDLDVVFDGFDLCWRFYLIKNIYIHRKYKYHDQSQCFCILGSCLVENMVGEN